MPKGLDRLSNLMREAEKPLSPEEQRVADADEARFFADVEKVMAYATSVANKAAGGEASLFDVQMLIEACAEAVRESIRDEVEGDEDDDE